MRAVSKTNSGYTIVEVMIFLAISGFMFVLAAAFVSGKQEAAEFRQGMNDTASQIQSAINDVAKGFYPSANNFSCSAGSSNPPRFTSSGSEQGTNKDCIFMGKVLQFGVQGSDSTEYNVYTIAGRQFSATDNALVPTSFNDAMPVVVDPDSGSAIGSPPDLTSSKTLEWGLQATHIYSYDKDDVSHTDPGNVRKEIGAFGFFGSFGDYSFDGFEGNGLLQSSAQSTAVVIFNNSTNKSKSEMVKAINGSPLGSGIGEGDVVGQPNIVICLTGGRNQKGSIVIGGGTGNRLSVTAQLGNDVVKDCKDA